MADFAMLAVQTVMQDAHIEPNPSVDPGAKHHLREGLSSPRHSKKAKTSHDGFGHDMDEFHEHHHRHGNDEHEEDHHETASISSSILHRHARRTSDSYLASISAAEGDPWKVAMITIRDQVVFPLAQGMLFSLGMAGWRAWNVRARFMGRGLGARIRRWWWGVNSWPIPEQ
ncbi:hypothetical protein BDZ91DRAFT_731333 [Kalaharituber pfeilii]|nr:hypothetical protein BDZ91DRAFT_731333 [Kalaharituber pfeilii]